MRRTPGQLVLLATLGLSTGAAALPLSYGGRLTGADGRPVAGPVDAEVRFFRSADGSDQVGPAVAFPGTPLQDGLFQVQLDLAAGDAQAVFGDGSQPVFVEVRALGKTYPRQRFTAVPYALRVPVDGTTIGFNAGGELTYLGSSGVATVSGAAPVTVTGSATAPVVGIAQAGAGSAGYLSAADWTAFNGKQAALGYTPVSKAGDTMTGALSVLAPTAADHATPKSYVDGMLGGFALDQAAKFDQYVVKWDGTAGKFVLGADQLGAAGGGIQSVNGLNATAQTLAIGTAGTAPAWTSATSTHTLDIPMASVAGVTAGLISKTDYDAFTAKQAAITAASTVNAGTVTTALGTGLELKNAGTVRFDELTANGANYVALKAPDTLAGNVTYTLPTADGAAGHVLKTDGSGNLAWTSVTTGTVTSVATGTGLAGGPITGSGTVSLADTAVTAGSYTRASITVDAQGRLTAASNGAAVNLASETSGTLAVGSGGTGATSFANNGVVLGSGSLPLSATAAGTANQVLRVPAGGGAPAFGAVDVSAAVTGTLPVANGGTGAATAATNLVFAAPNGSTGAPSFRALAAADIPTLTAAKISDFATATAAAETDPQVGTLTANKWCVANAGGTAVDCATNAPVLTESDPKVGTNAANYLSKWNGTALVTSSVVDTGNVGIGTTAPNALLEVSKQSTDATVAQEVLRVTTSGRSAATGTAGRSALIGFSDAFNPTLTGALGGYRAAPTANFNGGLVFYVNNTNGASASAVTDLSEAMRINNAGTVSVNGGTGMLLSLSGPATASPHLSVGAVTATDGQASAKILLNGNGIEHGGIVFTPSATLANEKLQFTRGPGADPSAHTPLMTVLGNGSVGVGTTSPQSQLQVNGGVQIGDDAGACPGTSNVKLGTLRYNAGTTLQVCTAAGWTAIGGSGNVVTGSYTGNGAACKSIALGFRPRMVVVKNVNGTYNGQIVTIDGIPDTANQTRIYAANGVVADAGAAKITNTGFDGCGPVNDSSFNVNGASYYYVAVGDVAQGSQWTSNAGDVYYSAGKVGIGTTAPDAALHVYGLGGGTVPAVTGSTDATMNQRVCRGSVCVDTGMMDNGTAYTQTRAATNFASNYPIAINPNGGNVGIGTTAPGYTLDVNGRIKSPKTFQGGTVTINGSGTWQSVTFPTAFAVAPVVTATTSGYPAGGSYCTAMIQSVTTTGFQVLCYNIAAPGVHTGADLVSWIAILP